MSRPDRKAMLDRDRRGLSIRRQCVLLSLARSGIYRPQRPANDDDLVLMRRIDQLFLAWPFLGSRRMTAMLRAEGLEVNRKRVRRLMRLMGIAALGPKPRTTKPQHGHKIFPYLLRDLVIERPPRTEFLTVLTLAVHRVTSRPTRTVAALGPPIIRRDLTPNRN